MKIAQGNPTTYLSYTLTWEKGRQLKKFDNIEYTYNANGIRTSKTVNGRLGTSPILERVTGISRGVIFKSWQIMYVPNCPEYGIKLLRKLGVKI